MGIFGQGSQSLRCLKCLSKSGDICQHLVSFTSLCSAFRLDYVFLMCGDDVAEGDRVAIQQSCEPVGKDDVAQEGMTWHNGSTRKSEKGNCVTVTY